MSLPGHLEVIWLRNSSLIIQICFRQYLYQRPARLPVYEHHIDAPFISKILGENLDPAGLNPDELTDYYRKVIGFWKDMTYDGFDFEAIRRTLPEGMKAFGGCGYGIFEASRDIVGYEPLCVMQCMDPDLFRDIFIKIGVSWVELWEWVIKNYSDIYVFFRMGEDLGHKTSTLLDPEIIRQHILPQYKRIIDLVHARLIGYDYN